MEQIKQKDMLKYIKQFRPYSKWKVLEVGLTTFVIDALTDYPIGQTKGQFPTFLKDTGIESLLRNAKNGKTYTDNFYFCRCLAFFIGASKKL